MPNAFASNGSAPCVRRITPCDAAASVLRFGSSDVGSNEKCRPALKSSERRGRPEVIWSKIKSTDLRKSVFFLVARKVQLFAAWRSQQP
jgi:hypothetical protein